MVLWGFPLLACASEIRVAVASNFKPAMVPLVNMFESLSEHEVTVSYASTGKHFAQISNGAPFDLFLAADVQSPRLLEDSGHAVSGSRFTYATGRLVLWSRSTNTEADVTKILRNRDFRFLSIANPRTAPYGRAAKQLLQNLDLWDQLEGQIVRGENVAQAYAFVSTGNAEYGLLSLSQVSSPAGEAPGQAWLIPEDLYEPIDQQAAVITNNPSTLEFAEFLRGSKAVRIIEKFGYSAP